MSATELPHHSHNHAFRATLRAFGATLRAFGVSPKARVQAALKLLGVSQEELAAALGCSPGHLSHVLEGRESNRLRRAIAHFFGIEISDIWPPDEGESLPHSLPHPGGAHTENTSQEMTR